MSEKRKLKCLIARPAKHAEPIEVEDSLQGIYDAIGGGCDIIEAMCCGDDWVMYIDECGKFRTDEKGRRAQPLNRSGTPFGITGDLIFGSILVMGVDDEGGNCDLSAKAKKEVRDMLEDSMLFLKYPIAGIDEK